MIKKIIVVTTSLDLGGITSFLIPMVNELVNMGNEVTLAYTFDNGDFLKEISDEVKLIKYRGASKIRILLSSLLNFNIVDPIKLKFRNKKNISPISSIQKLNYYVAKMSNISQDYYDIAISTAEFYCNAVVSFKINAKLKIGWFHPDVGMLEIDKKSAQKIIDKMDYLVTVSKEGLDSFMKLFPKDSKKFVYIPNIIDDQKIKRLSLEPILEEEYASSNKNIVTVCRLDNSSKRLDRIIPICLILKKEGVDFRWNIIGTGKDEQYLMDLIIANNLNKEVHLLGAKNNPYPYIKASNYFILTSQYEGKPIVIEEAKILHVPIICTNYSSANDQIPTTLGAVVSNIDGQLEKEIAKYIMDEKWYSGIVKSNKNYKVNNNESISKIKNIIESI